MTATDLRFPRKACIHHWRIESPAGRTSRGVCILCDTERVFDNWGEREPSRQRWAKGLKTIAEKRYTTKGEFVR